jgi:hypothetical protein
MPKIDGVFTNRGAAGLLDKLPERFEEEIQRLASERRKRQVVKNKIADGLKKLEAVDIASIQFDPLNARLHPERNLEAIKDSLCKFGQQTPIVVHKDSRIVLKGNGTLRAAIDLGWTKIVAVFTDMSESDVIGYSLADNRTSELATWDVANLKLLQQRARELGDPAIIGFSDDEVFALLNDGFVAPPPDFPEIDESLEVEHVCPKCGYKFSGGQTETVDEETNGEAE